VTEKNSGTQGRLKRPAGWKSGHVEWVLLAAGNVSIPARFFHPAPKNQACWAKKRSDDDIFA
jgi:hypothetical protein